MFDIPAGQYFTAAAVLVSASGLAYSWHKDRKLREREIADRIRLAAGTLLAKLERRKILSLRLREAIQPSFVDADAMATRGVAYTEVRDLLWRAITSARDSVSQSIADEEIESAYADLYGHDPHVRDLFLTAIDRLSAIDEEWFLVLLHRTQDDVIRMVRGPILSAQLGNALRRTCSELVDRFQSKMELIVEGLRTELIKLIEASDGEIYRRAVRLRAAETVFPYVASKPSSPRPIVLPRYEERNGNACELMVRLHSDLAVQANRCTLGRLAEATSLCIDRLDHTQTVAEDPRLPDFSPKALSRPEGSRTSRRNRRRQHR